MKRITNWLLEKMGSRKTSVRRTRTALRRNRGPVGFESLETRAVFSADTALQVTELLAEPSRENVAAIAFVGGWVRHRISTRSTTHWTMGKAT